MPTYRLKLYPTVEQRRKLNQFAGATRWLWNHLLDLQQKTYAESGIFVFRFELDRMLPALKTEYPWLREVPGHTLKRVCRNLDLALRHSFGAGKGFPGFKAKFGSRTSFYVSNDTLRVDGSRIVLPKLGGVRFRTGRLPDGKLMGATVAFDGRAWWCIVQVQVEAGTPLIAPVADTVVGVDMGLQDLLVASDGLRVAAPRHLRKAQRRLARAQRVLSRRKKGSARRRRQAAVVRKLHVRVADCRHDTQHKATRGLVDRASAIVIEDLNVSAMSRAPRLGMSVADAGLGELRRQIAYKATWSGKTIVIADRFFPSTQACSHCGTVKAGADRLQLHHRTYRCDVCGHIEDRDLNAAQNLRRYGLQSLGLICPGDTVSQALPEPAEIHIVPPSYARGETRSGVHRTIGGQGRFAEAGTADQRINLR